ncbi:glycoside hydrolase family 3 protein [Aerococcaceae bacterium zg-BR9]|uniref:glycoside hydrolase family 3 C-terminal domain-containing protein n=1 Tax=Aerococcaceae bacterium zg-1292 TaxID=2774330 RepID=UPI004063EF51|nr:glycoside hydrolase family 3 protein [Aerococcaceae bacterium zg-BR9]
MRVETVTQIMAFAVPAIALILLGYLLFLAKKSNWSLLKKNKVFAVLVPLFLVIITVLNIAMNMFNNVVNLYLSSKTSDSEAVELAQENSKAITAEIQGEGIVLLENKNNSLPLEKNSKLNVFGIGSVATTFGGSGSGASDESNNVTVYQGLKDAGFELNPNLVKYYESNKPKKEQQNNFDLTGGDYNIYEPTSLTDEMVKEAVDYSDSAVVVFSRNGGEGGDLPMDMEEFKNGDAGKSYLELQDIELALLEKIKSAGFKKVIVLINSSNAMELGFLEDEGITAALWIGGPGATGNTSVAKVLDGSINPSGRLVDTYAYDLTTAPAYYNAGDFAYLNGKHELGPNIDYFKFLNYNEGIYVGYRFYETRFVDNVTGETDEAAYEKLVQYPFGYGLSYTTFEQKIESSEVKDGQVTVKVKVTNTGEVAGKDVVQVYYTAPYIKGGIEKSHVVLAAFGKTEELKPGASETVELSYGVDEMASYDYVKAKAYVLDKGTYEIKVMNNAHEVIDSFEYEQKETVTFNESPRNSDNVVATNQFDKASGDLKYVSRADWEGTLPTERTKHGQASDELIDLFTNPQYKMDDSAEEIVTANHGLTIEDLRGKDFDDPLWDKLLEQLSVDDMVKLIGYGGFATQAIDSVGLPATVNSDGPAGINNLLTGSTGVQFTSGVVIASTWNQNLAAKLGNAMAQEAIAIGTVGLYAPGANLHRTPFSGRNFEYYSEDPVISGKIAAATVKAAKEDGVFMYIKHFAVNDQEINRLGVATWLNEQSLRELYLKAFEIPVKEGESTGIMSSFNRIGATWTGGYNELLNTVLRDEWGFKGTVVTDYNYRWFMDPTQAVLNGGDLMLNPVGKEPTAAKDTTQGRQALRRASKNIMYTVLNSAAVENYDTSFPLWLTLWIIGNVLVLTTLGTWIFLKNKKMKKVELEQ